MRVQAYEHKPIIVKKDSVEKKITFTRIHPGLEKHHPSSAKRNTSYPAKQFFTPKLLTL